MKIKTNQFLYVLYTLYMSESWTTKYGPKSIKDIVGNINVIKDGVRYLKSDKLEIKSKADCPKAILISGPSGTGKSEFAKMLSLYRGYIPMEFSAALLRKKQEVEHCIDIYRSDVRKNFSANHPLVIEALTNLDSCNMIRSGLGAAICIDELDATSKGYKGLITALMTILKSTTGHNPKRVIIFTCDDDTLTSKLKSLKNQCYHLSFKRISDREMVKLIDRVCDGEHISITQEDKQQLCNYSNGDCRRLLNGMELCFKNGADVNNQKELSNLISAFIKNDTMTIERLKYSTLSPDKILGRVIEESLDKKPEDNPFKIIPFIQGDSYSLGAQIFQTYPTLVRQDINQTEQVQMLAKAAEDVSYADFFIEQVRQGYGMDDDFIHLCYFIIYGVISPITRIREGIPKNFKVQTTGYAKVFGLQKAIDSQLDITSKLGRFGKLFYGKDVEEIRYVASNIARLLKEEKYEELTKLFYDNDIDFCVMDDIEKIRYMHVYTDTGIANSNSNRYRYLGPELKHVWKGAVKRKFKKQYTEDKPIVQGVKFKDEKNVKKINFFEKYESSNKKKK